MGTVYERVTGHSVAVPHSGPPACMLTLENAIHEVETSIYFVIHGPKRLLQNAYHRGQLQGIVNADTVNMAMWLAVLTDPHVRQDYFNYVPSNTIRILNRIREIVVYRAINGRCDIMELGHLSDLVFGEFKDQIEGISSRLIENAMSEEESDNAKKIIAMDSAARDDTGRVRVDDTSEFDADVTERVPSNPSVCLPPRHASSDDPTSAIFQSLQRLADPTSVNQTSKDLANEYAFNRDILAGSYPWIFLLGHLSAFKSEGIQSVPITRHLMLQFTAAAATCNNLVFHLADQRQRSAVNIGVSVRVSTQADSMVAFHSLMNDVGFLETLKEASMGNLSCQDTVRKQLLRHVSIPGSRVPGSDMARRESTKTMMAIIHRFGLPSVFWTLSLDDTRNLLSARTSMASTWPDSFPAKFTEEFENAFATGGCIPSPPGYTSASNISFSDAALRKRIAANPIAAAETFYSVIHAILAELFGLPPQTDTRKSILTHEMVGIYGRPYAFFGVTETQGRGSLHFHMLCWGQYSPALLQQILYSNTYREAVLKGMATMFQCSLPDDAHIAMAEIRARNANQDAGTQPIYMPKQQRVIPKDQLFDSNTGGYTDYATARIGIGGVCYQVHDHSFTCHKPPQGRHRCRVCFPVKLVSENPGRIFRLLPVHGVGYKVIEIPASPDQLCTSDRDFWEYPVPIRCKNIDVWELYRPRITSPEFDHPCYVDLPERLRNWISAIVPSQNGLVTPFNPPTLFLEPGNQCAYPLWGPAPAAITSRYTVKYIAKDAGELAEAAAILYQAQRRTEQYPSVADDSGTPVRSATHFCQSILHQINGRRELSAPQAASLILGRDLELCSELISQVYATDAIAFVKQMIKEAGDNRTYDDTTQFDDYSRTERDDDSYDNSDSDSDDSEFDDILGNEGRAKAALNTAASKLSDDLPATSSGSGRPTGQAFTLSNGEVVVVRQIVNYVYRGPELNRYSLVDYVELIKICKISSKGKSRSGVSGGTATGSGRGNDQPDDDDAPEQLQDPRQETPIFPFLPGHPLHGEYVQKLRSKWTCASFIGPPPSIPESIESDIHQRLLLNCALYYRILFYPFSIDDLSAPAELLDTSYNAFVEMMQSYQSTSHISDVATKVGSQRYNQIINMAHGLRCTSGEAKLQSIYRNEACTKWATCDPIADGTANPPGKEGISGRSGASEEDDTVQIARDLATMRVQQATEQMQLESTRDLLTAMIEESIRYTDKENLQLLLINKTLSNLADAQGPIANTFGLRRNTRLHSTATYNETEIERVKSAINTNAADTDANDDDSGSDGRECGGAARRRRFWVPPDPNITGLNEGQLEIFQCVAPYLVQAAQSRDAAMLSGLPKPIFLSGGPGVGKTFTVNRILEYADALDVPYICGAFSASAATNLKSGATLHSLFQIPVGATKRLPPLSAQTLETLQARFSRPNKRVRLLFIDELSMVDPEMLSFVSSRLKDIMNSTQEFGGLLVMCSGDMAQIHPVGGTCLTSAAVKDSGAHSPDSAYIHGKNIFCNLEVHELTQQMRASGEHARFLAEMRDQQQITHEILNQLKVLTRADIDDDPNWEFAPVCVAGNAERNAINRQNAQRFAEKHGRPLLAWLKPIAGESNFGSTGLTDQQRQSVWSTNPGLHHLFVEGAPAYMNANIGTEATRKEICNGSKLKMTSLYYKDPHHRQQMDQRIASAAPGQVVWVDPPDEVIFELEGRNGAAHRLSESESLEADKPTIPLSANLRETYKVSLDNGRAGKITVVEFPFELGFAVTYHRIQGRTLPYLILDANASPLPPHILFELLYVGLSRVPSASRIRLLPSTAINGRFDHLLKLKLHKDTVLWLLCISVITKLFDSKKCQDLIKEFSAKKKSTRRNPSKPVRSRDVSCSYNTPYESQADAGNTQKTKSSATGAWLSKGSLSSHAPSKPIPSDSCNRGNSRVKSVQTDHDVLYSQFHLRLDTIEYLYRAKSQIKWMQLAQDNYFPESLFIQDIASLNSVFGEMQNSAINSFFSVINLEHLGSYAFLTDVTNVCFEHSPELNSSLQPAYFEDTNSREYKCRHVFFPALVNKDHYVLLWIDNCTGMYTIYDPLGPECSQMVSRIALFENVLLWFDFERYKYHRISGSLLQYAPLKKRCILSNSPRQEDAIHCGQYICCVAYYISIHDEMPTNKDFSFINKEALELFVLKTLITGDFNDRITLPASFI